MGQFSHIEWTTHTFNLVWGCTNVSEGCRNCYAASLARRFGHQVWGRNAQRRVMSDGYWQQPYRWNEQAARDGRCAQVFCSSMADVFEDHPTNNQERPRLWEVIRETPHLNWQLLTKRPQNIAGFLPDDWGAGYDNVWLGTSVEDERVMGRIDDLVAVPASVHFLSCEPLIGPLYDMPLDDIEWVIVGGESGPRARPIERPWVNSIRRQCVEAGVPFFFKQWGGVRKQTTGRRLNGTVYNNMPAVLAG